LLSSQHFAVVVVIYVPKDCQEFPTEEHPIVQSYYVDTFLRGCLSVGGEEFARSFTETTKGWNPEEFLAIQEESRTDAINMAIASTVAASSKTTPRRVPLFPTTSKAATAPTQPLFHRNSAIWIDDRNKPIYPRSDSTYMRENTRRHLHGMTTLASTKSIQLSCELRLTGDMRLSSGSIDSVSLEIESLRLGIRWFDESCVIVSTPVGILASLPT
jgi:hypothetical protein